MKERTTHYKAAAGNQTKEIKFKVGKKTFTVRCLDKKYFDKEKDKDKLIGSVSANNKEYTGKEFAEVSFDDLDMKIDVKGDTKAKAAAYLMTTAGEYIAVTAKSVIPMVVIPAAAAVCITAGVLVFMHRPEAKAETIAPNPDFSEVTEETTAETADKMSVDIVLPDGDVSYGGTVFTYEDEVKKQSDADYEGEAYTGNAEIVVTLPESDGDHTVIDADAVITKGAIEDSTLDFTTLDFELQTGVTEGTIEITYPDGNKVEKEIDIIVRQTSGGSASLVYSGNTEVDLATSTITMNFSTQDASTDEIVQLIVKDGDNEYILGQSGKIHSGGSVTTMTLDDSMKDRLQTGTYDGVIRVFYDSVADSASQTAFKTDLEVTINVK